jgi:UDP-N-acetylenolpyruvoylglucosamine reductase
LCGDARRRGPLVAQADFIINPGDARARDIARLVEHARSRVEPRHGVRLIPEVRRVGDLQ